MGIDRFSGDGRIVGGGVLQGRQERGGETRSGGAVEVGSGNGVSRVRGRAAGGMEARQGFVLSGLGEGA